MSRRGNWDRLRVRDRMRRFGTEDARGRDEDPARIMAIVRSVRPHWGERSARITAARSAPAAACRSTPTSPSTSAPRRRRPVPPSKAELRAQAAAAFMDWRERQQKPQ